VEASPLTLVVGVSGNASARVQRYPFVSEFGGWAERKFGEEDFSALLGKPIRHFRIRLFIVWWEFRNVIREPKADM
jgi:hypothetical protein